MDRLGQLQKPPKGLKCADWETAALNSQRNSSSRSLKEILELQSISLHAPSTDARLHESRGQMHEVDQALARHKEYYANEEKQFRVKEAQLKEKEAQLQLQLNRFNKFVDTNEDKRRRAEKRAAAEREIIREKEKTIVTLKVAVEQMEAKEQKLEAGVKRCASDSGQVYAGEEGASADRLFYIRVKLLEQTASVAVRLPLCAV
ncbi:hypothetical protein TGGT1_253340 [Toxoplasma gondii GT1]|uniref:DUF4200 domain-containing protein n=6 Tax=Toxoplasma gondii TaxID=5811 RepID=S7W1P2_TOXGG|nr:hypothetical protein TGGT1_253340 [Toxoplasma gondii GT1]KAF4645394.1 hypothetical protein TGRH88_004980 [Toxoplasma gondii]KFG52904.1 hypothetical protein TGFOU_253340 [Toxoplasma gondii FOU]KFH14922.1 hypothetical protein TGMAS_253340 [Toxoplasma gondii MAS]PUA89112.1 hypothetical protein TGBR9_253340 [Toxoplasma gondii TgCATBr9]RQX68679.1 hypothetical protein TGCAST_253340 [Toxoplasma gondii CAST]